MRAFAIVLKEAELAQTISNEAVAAAAQHGITVEIYDAVLGYNSQPLFAKYGLDKFLNYTMIDYPGHQGCFLSHYELWMKCVELDEPIIILEHDGIFVRPLPEDVLDHFDEVLRLDCFDWFSPTNTYNAQVAASLTEPVGYYRREPDFTWHSSGGYYVGAFGYIVKPQAAKKLIDHAQQRGVVCTEVHLGLAIVDVVSTTATVVRMHPHYIGQDVKFSTTYDLGLATKGRNSLRNPKYISPSQYKKQFRLNTRYGADK
jgi:GR25 family glycosyltransferase involved in LPS biosynthesis